MHNSYLKIEKFFKQFSNFKFSKENQDDFAQYFIGLATASTLVFFSLIFSETVNFIRAGFKFLCYANNTVNNLSYKEKNEMELFDYALIAFMVLSILFALFVRHHSEDNPRFKQTKSNKAAGKKKS